MICGPKTDGTAILDLTRAAGEALEAKAKMRRFKKRLHAQLFAYHIG
jgi:hypothetical protein